VVAYRGGASDAGFLGLEGGESLQPCWAKPALDGRGWVLRLHETLGRRGVARLRLAADWRASVTDLSEKPGESVEEIVFTPYQLVSIRIERSDA
ncbi:MAG: hypothetical protein H7Y06_07510, partial [Opitutaceae bacterium]|nr:hypothetical protein [Opitutaceae bacterium]